VERTHPLYLEKKIGIGDFLYYIIHAKIPSSLRFKWVTII
jgi:hypothetical protein